MASSPLLFWDFANVMNEASSVSVGVPSDPQVVSGFVGQTGGGPAEKRPKVGYVFLTRQLGTNEMFVWLTVTRAVFLADFTFTHWHSHRKGSATHPKYSLQLELSSDDEIDDIGKPLELTAANSGGTGTIEIGRELPAGSYCVRWYPTKLKNNATDTGNDFFAIKNLALNGHVLAAPKPAAPQAAAEAYVDVELAGVMVPRFKVMESKYAGTCSRTGEDFEAGATIGFKHRDALTAAHKAAIFGAKTSAHLTVLLPAAEVPVPDGEPVGCAPDPARLEPFRKALGQPNRRDEWKYGNLSSKAVAYSCGCLTREGRPLVHRHDPAELAACRRLADQTAARLRALRLNDEGDGAPFVPYFAAAPVGTPAPTAVDEALVRALFGGAISTETGVEVVPMTRVGRRWDRLHDTHAEPATDAAEAREWNAFGAWFTAQPGLTGHAFVRIGASDDEPGAVMPRLVVALTAAGSLVGAASAVVYA